MGFSTLGLTLPMTLLSFMRGRDDPRPWKPDDPERGNATMTLPNEHEIALIATYVREADSLQAVRRHVVRHHGRAEWSWLSTTTTERHGRERTAAARMLRVFRAAAVRHGCQPRQIMRMARQANL